MTNSLILRVLCSCSLALCISSLRINDESKVEEGGRGRVPWGAFDYILEPTMPKVGSRTMIKSLGGIAQPPEIKGGIDLEVKANRGVRQEGYPPIMKSQWTDVSLDFMSKIPPNKNVLILTMVRNPFLHLESVFWEGVDQGGYGGIPGFDQVMNMTDHEMAQAFEKALPARRWNGWLRGDFKQISGVNVLEHKFDHTKKRMFVQHRMNNTNVSVLVLRLEDAKSWESILQPYLPGWKMKVTNEASKKPVGQKYKQFKKSYRFPPAAVETLNASPQMHFYTKEEKEAMTERLIQKLSLEEVHKVPDFPESLEVGDKTLFLGDLDELGEDSQ